MRATTLAALCGTAAFLLLTGSPASTDEAAKPAIYTPSFGDLMNTLIQPRHEKLGLAGAAKNWPLAAYALKDLEESFVTIGKVWPETRNLLVPDMIELNVGPGLKGLEAAVKARDLAKFDEAYGRLTAGCNACHSAARVPYVAIKAPDQSAFPNQDFAPRR
jgi:hypothetical protein